MDEIEIEIRLRGYRYEHRRATVVPRLLGYGAYGYTTYDRDTSYESEGDERIGNYDTLPEAMTAAVLWIAGEEG